MGEVSGLGFGILEVRNAAGRLGKTRIIGRAVNGNIISCDNYRTKIVKGQNR